MKTYVQEGDILTLTAPYAVAAGGGVLVGKIFGIAQSTAANGALVDVVREGVFTHAKTSAQAWTEGAAIYWDNTGKVFTTVATANTLVGAAAAVAVNPSATGNVLLDGAIR